jgi:nicotinamide-nucleotide amidase
MVKYSKSPLIDTNTEIKIAKLCMEWGYKLAIAESCTGGLIGHRITNLPGSSKYFLGSVVAYDYSVKRGVLGVEPITLEMYGAVSKETALEMAVGTRNLLSSDEPVEKTIGVSVTGIAGPEGGTPDKPVGLVWIGISNYWYRKAASFIWNGNRLENKEFSCQAALNQLLETLRNLSRYKSVMVRSFINFSGTIEPQALMSNNQEIPITATGRRWQDELGNHVLAMIPGGTVLELIISTDGNWYFRPVSRQLSHPDFI